MKVRIDGYSILFFILSSIFLFGNQIRYGLSPVLYQVNVIYIVVLLMLFVKYGKCLQTKDFLLWIALTMQMLIVNLMNDCTGSEIFRNFMIMYLPLLLLMFDFSSIIKDRDKSVRKLIKIYNFFVYVQLVIYFADTVLGGTVIKWFASHLTPKISQYLVNRDFGLFTYRFTSYLGQSLFVSEVFVIFLLLNLFYNKKSKEILCNRYFIYAVSILGVLIAGSRTGTFLVAAVITVDLLFEKRKALSIIVVMCLFILIQYLGVFDVLLGRMSAVSLTAGRNEAWELLKKANVLNIHLFYGTGMRTHDLWTQIIGSSRASNAFEYPVRTLIYRIGLLPMLGWCYIMFFKPLKTLIRTGGGILFLAVLIIEVNTFNGISEVSDLVLLYALSAQLILIIAKMGTESCDKY